MKQLIGLVLSIIVYHLGFSQNPNRPIPPDFPDYEFELNDLSFQGHYFAHAYKPNTVGYNNMFLLDSLGYIAWFRKDLNPFSLDFKYHQDLGVFSFIETKIGSGSTFHTMDEQFNILDTLVAQNGEDGDVHEFVLTESGNKIILTRYNITMDLSDYFFNGQQGLSNANVRGFGIQEFDAQNNLLWTWRSTDHIHPVEFLEGLNYSSNEFNYAHGNSIDIDTDQNLIVSFRNTGGVYKIDRANQTGEIIWKLGGENPTFELPQQHTFSAQHYARILPNGNLGLYDNGNLRSPIKYSQAAEYSLDLLNESASLVWTYHQDQSIYSANTGNAQWLEDDLVFINWGSVNRPNPTGTLVNKNGEIQSQLIYQDLFVSYRVQLYELGFNLPRPQINYELVNDSMVLTAPSGHLEYLWSNGATTQSITVAENGTYQVWVPLGIGYVGSYPVEAELFVSTTDLNEIIPTIYPNPASDQLTIECQLDGFENYSIAIFNNLGRKVVEDFGLSNEINHTIDTEFLVDGVYYLSIFTSEKQYSQKIVISK